MKIFEFRNEASGALTGLTRVRKFHQEDAHIFCTPDQILTEIKSTLQLIDRIYTKVFNFPYYSFALSTRPSKSIGTDEQWSKAEDALQSALDSTNRSYTIKHADGAFYGPKIDVTVRDAMGREHQTATIQLDFQLPSRFNLTYNSGVNSEVASQENNNNNNNNNDNDISKNEEIQNNIDGNNSSTFRAPVMIHRAILGSVERMMAILMEHYAGGWPFWLSPRQAIVIPATSNAQVVEYAEKVGKVLANGGRGYEEIAIGGSNSPVASAHNYYYVDTKTHDADLTLSKRVRDALIARYNYVIVVGEKEMANGYLSVRERSRSTDMKDITKSDKFTTVAKTMSFQTLLDLWSKLEQEFQ